MKISEMTEAASPILGTDVAPIVRSGQNFKTTFAKIKDYVLSAFAEWVEGDTIATASDVKGTDVTPFDRAGSAMKATMAQVKDYVLGQFSSKLADSTPADTIADADISPIVQSEETRKATMSQVKDYVLDGFGAKTTAAGTASDLTDADLAPVVQSGTMKRTTLATLAEYVFSKACRPKYCAGSFETNGADTVAVTFPRELSGRPIVVCTPLGNQWGTFYPVKVDPTSVSATGFTAHILSQSGGTTGKNESVSLAINYIAIVN